MIWQRFIIKTHKWLAAGVGLFTFLWFLSGIAMIMPLLLPTGVPAAASAVSAPQGDAGPYRQIAVSVPQAIQAAEIAAGHPLRIARVALRPLAGELIYEIDATGSGPYLIDAMNARRWIVNEELARRIAAQKHGIPSQWSPIELVREHTREYKDGPLPVYRVAAGDSNASLYFISRETGEVTASSTRAGRLRMMIAQLHGFGFLRPELNPLTATSILFVFGSLGLLMSLFGGGILALQFWNWWGAHRRVG